MHFLQWHVYWILICDWNRPYHVWQLLLGFTLCTLCSPLACRIIHRKSTLRLSKRIDLPLPPAHHLLFFETEFDVYYNDVLTSFQCVGIIPILSVMGTIALLHNSIHFAPAVVWFSSGGAHFSFCWQYPYLRCCDVSNYLVVCGIVRLIIIVLWDVTKVQL